MARTSEPNANEQFIGTVSWFRDNLGYGFIEVPELGKPVFAHYSKIMTSEDFKTLSKGQIVTLQIAVTTKGYMGINIRESVITKAKAELLTV